MDDQPSQSVYFVGITLPADLDSRIATLKWQLHDTNKAALVPLLPHVTLLHPPSLRGIMPAELLPRVHEIAQRYLPLTVVLDEIGFFDGTVCYIRVESLGLISLQSQLVGLLPDAVRTMHYKRDYTPHITMVQVHEPATLDKERTRAAIATRLKLPAQFQVDSVAYFARILPHEYRSKAI